MLADSTLLIDFLRGKEKAVHKVMNISSTTTLFTTEINVFELVTCVNASGKNVEDHLEKVWALLAKIEVLPLDRRATLLAGKIAGTLLKKGQKIEDADCLIAAIGLANGVSEILTENKEHFERIPGLKVISY